MNEQRNYVKRMIQVEDVIAFYEYINFIFVRWKKKGTDKMQTVALSHYKLQFNFMFSFRSHRISFDLSIHLVCILAKRVSLKISCCLRVGRVTKIPMSEFNMTFLQKEN